MIKERRESQRTESNSQLTNSGMVKTAKRVLKQQKMLVKLLRVHKELGKRMKSLEMRYDLFTKQFISNNMRYDFSAYIIYIYT